MFAYCNLMVKVRDAVNEAASILLLSVGMPQFEVSLPLTIILFSECDKILYTYMFIMIL
jgi:hypothetical protein